MKIETRSSRFWRRRFLWLVVAVSPLLLIFVGILGSGIFTAWIRPIKLPDPEEDLPSLVRKIALPVPSRIPSAPDEEIPPAAAADESLTSSPNRAMVDELVRGSEKWSTSVQNHRNEIRAAIDQMLSSMTVYSESTYQLKPQNAFDSLILLENQFNELVRVFGKASGKQYYVCTVKNGGETYIKVQRLSTRWLARELWKLSMRSPDLSLSAAEYIDRQLESAQTADQMAAAWIDKQWPDPKDFDAKWGDELRDMQIDCLRRAGGWRNALESLNVPFKKQKYNLRFTMMHFFAPSYEKSIEESLRTNTGIPPEIREQLLEENQRQ